MNLSQIWVKYSVLNMLFKCIRREYINTQTDGWYNINSKALEIHIHIHTRILGIIFDTLLRAIFNIWFSLPLSSLVERRTIEKADMQLEGQKYKSEWDEVGDEQRGNIWTIESSSLYFVAADFTFSFLTR